MIQRLSGSGEPNIGHAYLGITFFADSQPLGEYEALFYACLTQNPSTPLGWLRPLVVLRQGRATVCQALPNRLPARPHFTGHTQGPRPHQLGEGEVAKTVNGFIHC